MFHDGDDFESRDDAFSGRYDSDGNDTFLDEVGEDDCVPSFGMNEFQVQKGLYVTTDLGISYGPHDDADAAVAALEKMYDELTGSDTVVIGIRFTRSADGLRGP